MGTLVVNEDRKIIDKFRSWYKEKIVDTGKAAKYEKRLSSMYDILRKKNDVTGAVLPTILTFIPEASFLAPIVPSLVKIGNKCYDLEQGVALGAKRFAEANFLGVDGSSKEVVIPSLDVENLSKDIAKTTRDIGRLVSETNTESLNVESVGKSR